MIGAGNAWQVFLKKIRDEIKAKTDDLVSGKFTDYAQAKELTGKIDALKWALGTAQDTLGDKRPEQQTADEEDDAFA
jgi:hypothetical protein